MCHKKKQACTDCELFPHCPSSTASVPITSGSLRGECSTVRWQGERTSMLECSEKIVIRWHGSQAERLQQCVAGMTGMAACTWLHWAILMPFQACANATRWGRRCQGSRWGQMLPVFSARLRQIAHSNKVIALIDQNINFTATLATAIRGEKWCLSAPFVFALWSSVWGEGVPKIWGMDVWMLGAGQLTKLCPFMKEGS